MGKTRWIGTRGASFALPLNSDIRRARVSDESRARCSFRPWAATRLWIQRVRSEIDPIGGTDRLCRVLVIDDDPDIAEPLALSLRFKGYCVETAWSGHEALWTIRWFNPDAVILDLCMPGIDGYETAQQILSLPNAPAPRLVALIEGEDQEAREKAQTAGFSAHLKKSAEVSDILRLLTGLQQC